VPEANRLQLDTSFRDTARVLRMTRAFVGWEAVGCMMGAYEHALRYAQTRLQFGKPIASFQLVQDLLVKMLGNITASLCMVVRLSKMQDEGHLGDEHASLAKAFCTVRMRESVGYARELLGANASCSTSSVGRFVADAEAIYSYEGTREMQTLIVGRVGSPASARSCRRRRWSFGTCSTRSARRRLRDGEPSEGAQRARPQTLAELRRRSRTSAPTPRVAARS
jgi:glutaryl-CoA dehydrogenase